MALFIHVECDYLVGKTKNYHFDSFEYESELSGEERGRFRFESYQYLGGRVHKARRENICVIDVPN